VDAAALGAIPSGIAAVISSAVSLWLVRRRERADCDKRVEEVVRALHEGIELGRQ
jgi:uncharacterized membrane protein YdjX (TVP38/TMEM64 family)